MVDIQELKRLASKATPGPWGMSYDKRTVTSNRYHPIATLTEPFHRQCDFGTGQDAEFISAANPETVLELISRLELTEYRLKTAEAALRKMGTWPREFYRIAKK